MAIMKEKFILKYDMNKKECLLVADGKNINRVLEKAQIFSICFCSIFGIKEVDVSMSYDTADKIQHLPSVTKGDVRQHLRAEKQFFRLMHKQFSLAILAKPRQRFHLCLKSLIQRKV